jgi:hypothetical protein
LIRLDGLNGNGFSFIALDRMERQQLSSSIDAPDRNIITCTQYDQLNLTSS